MAKHPPAHVARRTKSNALTVNVGGGEKESSSFLSKSQFQMEVLTRCHRNGNLQSREQGLETMGSPLEFLKPPQEDMTVMASQAQTGWGQSDNLLDQYPSPGVRSDSMDQGLRAGSSSDIVDSLSTTATTCHNAQQTSHGNLTVPQNLPERPQDSNSKEPLQSLLARFPVFNLAENRLKDLRGTMTDGAFSGQDFIPMFPKAEILPLVEEYFDEVNALFPLFQKQSFMDMCQNKFPVDSESEGPAWWACLNTVIAMGIRLKATNRGFRKVSEVSWGFFKNAFSVYQQLIATESGVLSVQAVLAMAIFSSGTTDTKMTAVLSSTASRMIYMMGLHQENPENNFDPAEADERRRVFWIAYLIDRGISINSGLPFTIENGSFEVAFPREILPGFENLPLSNETEDTTVFRLRIQLAIIESKLQKYLSSRSSLRFAGQISLDQILQVHHELDTWKRNVSVEIQPTYDTDAVAGTGNLSVLMLHLAFYHCVGTVHRAILHQISLMRHNLSPLEAPTSLLLQSQLVSSTTICAQVARATLRLVQHMAYLPFADLW
ncbi:hypothetical protein ACEPPN_000860 [Leptodophora sp. 'Broadleaf-Isolate-01']